MAMRILADVINVETVMRVLDQRYANAVGGKVRDHLLNQRCLATT